MFLSLFSEKALRKALERRGASFIQDVFVFESVGSTNDEAKRLAQGGAPEGTLVVADEQADGRGRGENSWISLKGKGIYASLVLRPALEPSRGGELSLLVGTAAAEALSEETALRVELKWPNDLVIHGQKVGGILVEAAARGRTLEYAIAGIGINVSFERKELRGANAPATSLALEKGTGPVPPREEILAAVAARLGQSYREYQERGFSHLKNLMETVAMHRRGDALALQTGAGIRRGAYEGIEEGGLLRLRFEDGSVKAFDSDGGAHALRPSPGPASAGRASTP
jgi:BirA family biotin operon repressor/biotin-[acetyl-CoA-carboxylase] ligase